MAAFSRSEHFAWCCRCCWRRCLLTCDLGSLKSPHAEFLLSAHESHTASVASFAYDSLVGVRRLLALALACVETSRHLWQIDFAFCRNGSKLSEAGGICSAW